MDRTEAARARTVLLLLAATATVMCGDTKIEDFSTWKVPRRGSYWLASALMKRQVYLIPSRLEGLENPLKCDITGPRDENRSSGELGPDLGLCA
jgi:hypothetical protein